MKKSVLTVTINPAIDHFIFSNKEIKTAGGKGVNVSRALKSLDVPTLITGIVGGTSGGVLMELLGKEKLSNDLYKVTQETRTNTTFLSRTKIKRRVVRQGECISEFSAKGFKEKYKKLLKRSCMVVIAGRSLQGMPKRICADLVKLANDEGIPIAIDMHGDALRSAAKCRPTVIKINRLELKELFSLTKLNQQDIMRSVLALHRSGVGFVVISMGAQGAICSDGKEAFQLLPPKSRSPFDVGCGDSMLAGFVFSFMNGEVFLENCKWAVACGSANLRNFIPGAIQKKHVRDIFKKLKINRLR